MSFFGAAAAKDVPATVLVEGFQIQAMIPTVGLIQMFLSDEQKPILTLKDATVYGLEAGNPVGSMRIAELLVRKDQCHAVIFHEMLSREDSALLPRAEPLAVYTSHYVVQGEYHMGSDAYITDFMLMATSMFIGAANVTIFPLFQPRTAMIQQAPLAYVHRSTVRMHHKI
ncbi:MAG: hypothetical protein GXY36_19970 [Chloroflexi bacterium]|nr:hypothetical protein [Chloroflexota bacterium]